MKPIEIFGLIALLFIGILIVANEGYPSSGMYGERSMYEEFSIDDVDPSSENIVPDNNQYDSEDIEDDRNGYYPEDEQDEYQPQPEDNDYKTE